MLPLERLLDLPKVLEELEVVGVEHRSQVVVRLKMLHEHHQLSPYLFSSVFYRLSALVSERGDVWSMKKDGKAVQEIRQEGGMLSACAYNKKTHGRSPDLFVAWVIDSRCCKRIDFTHFDSQEFRSGQGTLQRARQRCGQWARGYEVNDSVSFRTNDE